MTGWRLEASIEYLKQTTNCHQLEACNNPQPPSLNGIGGKLSSKLMRKPSLERELSLQRGSPALDSGAGSSRSDSPRLASDQAGGLHHPQLSRQYSPSGFVEREPPPPPPPRCSSTPPPPPPPHAPYSPPNVPIKMQEIMKRMPPAPVVPSRAPLAAPGSSGSASGGSMNVPQRGTSPVSTGSAGRQPMIVQNGPQVRNWRFLCV